MTSSAGWANGLRRALDLIVELIIRKRSNGLRVMRCGVPIVLASLGGLSFTATRGDTTLFFGSEVWFPLSIVGLVIGALLLAFGGWLLFQETKNEQAARQRKRVLVVEQRGLQKKFATPLRAALPSVLVGEPIEKVIDVSPFFRDGALVDFGSAFMEVREARSVLRQGLGDVEPSDVTVVYGGVAPVPLTYLTGTYFDDLSAVVLMDWDRTASAWRGLDGIDDGDSLSDADLTLVPPGAEDVALALSVSYEVDEAAVRGIDDGWPILEMRMGRVEIGNHWSETKQRRIADAFVRVMARLADRGVLQVHLFLAAPNSVVFRLGRHLDRNWPALRVYQREPGDQIRFPWSIQMPSANAPQPQLCPTQLRADVDRA